MGTREKTHTTKDGATHSLCPYWPSAKNSAPLEKEKERDPNKIYTHQHGAMVETERNITSNKKR